MLPPRVFVLLIRINVRILERYRSIIMTGSSLDVIPCFDFFKTHYAKIVRHEIPPISYHIIIIDGVVKYPPAPGLVYSLHQIFAQGLKLSYLRPFRGLLRKISPPFLPKMAFAVYQRYIGFASLTCPSGICLAMNGIG